MQPGRANLADGSGLKVGIVAGEVSGDILGGRLMAAIRERRPQAHFVGIGGEAMRAEGIESVAPIDALSVNGFKDPLLKLPSLYRLLHRLKRRFLDDGMDVVVGVDFNVFNLMLERRVRQRGIPTAHYVSPSVYFWRRGRIKGIAKAADVVLALFPFEPALYAERGGNAVFVGHPLADEIGLDDGGAEARLRARRTLGVGEGESIVAMLPGSRRSEVDFLGRLFLDAAALLPAPFSDAVFLVPTPHERIHDAMAAVCATHAASRERPLDVRLVRGQSRTVIAAADLVLTKSGTATLETMLLRRPMVVAYRLGALSAWLVQRLKRSDFVALPNILAGRELVPELLQDDATPERLAAALVEQHERVRSDDDYLGACAHWHGRLRRNGAAKAAEAVLALVENA